MKTLAEFTKTTLIGGLLIILPIYVTLLLLAKAVTGVLALLAPVTAQLPAGVEFRQLIAIALLVAICFVVGLIVRTGPGLRAKNALGNRPAGAAAGWHSSCGGGGDGWFPVPGEEVGEAAGGVIGDAAQDVFEPGLWIDIVELGGGDQRVDRRRPARRRGRIRRTARLVGRRQSRGHSAHVGQDVEVCYRWHALYGRRVRRPYAERRAGGEVVHVEVAPGVVIVVAAWMLDPAACAGMGFGAPRVEVSALIDLHQLLIEGGFRRSSLDDPTIVQEEHDEKPADTGAAIRGTAPAQHAVRFRKASGDEPLGATDGAHPAGPSAIGGGRRRGEEERDDDER